MSGQSNQFPGPNQFQGQWQPGQQMQRPTTLGLPQDPMNSEWAKQGLAGPAAPRPGFQQNNPYQSQFVPGGSPVKPRILPSPIPQLPPR